MYIITHTFSAITYDTLLYTHYKVHIMYPIWLGLKYTAAGDVIVHGTL